MVRIPVESKYIEGALQRARDAKLPPELRAHRKPSLPPKTSAPVDSVNISNGKITPEQIKLHPEIPSADASPSNFEQVGDTYLTLATLMPELAKLSLSAKNEQKILVGAAV